MAVWFQIGLILNLTCWAVFFYLLSRRRRDAPALAVGVFHMLFAAVSSVAPVRSLLDPGYTGYGVGVFHFEGRAASLPAALVLAWALAAAWVTVGKAGGRWMRLVMVGDILFAASISVSTLLDDPRNWTFQLGEHFTAAGASGLLILLCLFTLPFIASAIWAAGRTRSGGAAPPVASNAREARGASEKDGENGNGFRYSESRI
jgi:hypothetical protein